MKQRLSPAVTTPRVAALYERARSAGALGGKLLGAGGGGFLLLFVRPDDRDGVRAALSELVFVPVGLDRYGSTVVANGFG
jgi:D-glycero-alpha-D-manno-heptose-7-phosphate kinase